MLFIFLFPLVLAEKFKSLVCRRSGIRKVTNLFLLACDLEFMDFSIEIDCKCLFNTRFSSFYFHLYLLRNSKVLFAHAQRIESVLILLCHVLDIVLTFNLSCVFVQMVRFHEFRPLISLPKHDRL